MKKQTFKYLPEKVKERSNYIPYPTIERLIYIELNLTANSYELVVELIKYKRFCSIEDIQEYDRVIPIVNRLLTKAIELSAKEEMRKKFTFSDVSKEVGWDEIKVKFPTKERIYYLEKNLKSDLWNCMVELLGYNRFCKLGCTKNQDKIMIKVIDLLRKSREILQKLNEN